MINKYYVFIVVLLILFSQNVFSKVQERSNNYYIINNSNEDLFITVKNNEFNIVNLNFGGARGFIDYYENGIIVDRLYVDDRFQNGNYRLQNHLLPNKNRWLEDDPSNLFGGTFYWKYVAFFLRRIPEYMYIDDRDEIIRIWGERVAEHIPPNIRFEYRWLTGYEILNIFIDEIIITDINGNIIIEINDIDETFFEENNVATHIEEYSESFYNLPRYRNFGNGENYISLYGIFITQEMVDNGRRRHMKQNIE